VGNILEHLRHDFCPLSEAITASKRHLYNLLSRVPSREKCLSDTLPFIDTTVERFSQVWAISLRCSVSYDAGRSAQKVSSVRKRSLQKLQSRVHVHLRCSLLTPRCVNPVCAAQCCALSRLLIHAHL